MRGCVKNSKKEQRMQLGRAIAKDGETNAGIGSMRPRSPEGQEFQEQHSLVGAVDVVNGQDGQVAVITEVTQGDARTSLELVVADGLLGGVEGDGHGEDVAIGKTAVLADAMHTPSVSEHCNSDRMDKRTYRS